MKSIIIIPARMQSVRLPGKPMLDIGGHPLVRRTAEQARLTGADAVLVVSPDKIICRYCQDNGIPWMASPDDIPSGTARCAEVYRRLKDEYDVVVNWQVDEPCVAATAVDSLIDLAADEEWDAATLCGPLPKAERDNENTVKAVIDEDGRIMWFSRKNLEGSVGHCGIYAFGADELLFIEDGMQPSRLSKIASLEQLTWIENRYAIGAWHLGELPPSVDTPEDLEKVRAAI